METSCSIGEVSPRLSHAQVCNLRGFFGKKPHALFDTAPRRLVRARYTGCPGALALPTSREAGIFARKLVIARRENITSVGSSKDQLTFFFQNTVVVLYRPRVSLFAVSISQSRFHQFPMLSKCWMYSRLNFKTSVCFVASKFILLYFSIC